MICREQYELDCKAWLGFVLSHQPRERLEGGEPIKTMTLETGHFFFQK